ncbi:C-type lectin domain-containing protein [Chryseobacterium sp. T1]
MKKLFLLTGLINSISAFSQVGIDTNPPHFSAALDMSAAKKGVIAPRISLTGEFDRTTINSPEVGLIIYQTGTIVPVGYYYYNGVKWKILKEGETTVNYTSDEINTNILGYYPSGSGATAPDQLILEGVTASKIKCNTFSGSTNSNSHSYCGYNLSKSVNWDTAYKIAKAINGYLAVITFSEEWNHIKTSFLDNPSGNSNNRIWIGFNKVDYKGKMVVDENNNQIGEYLWISGREPLVSWSNNSRAQPTQAWADSEPSQSYRSGYIKSKDEDASRLWATYDGALGESQTENKAYNYLIIEFLR